MNDRLDALSRTVARERSRAVSHRLRLEPLFELATSIAALLWTGGFLADNRVFLLRAPLGAFPAGALFFASAAALGLALWQLVIVSHLDYSASVAEVQGRIALLRAIRVRSSRSFIIAGFALWFLFPILVGQALFGVEFIAVLGKLDRAWLVSNLLLGFGMGLALAILSRRFAGRSRLLAAIDDVLAGTAVANAERALREVEEFRQG